jgi:beta-glucosidase
MVGYKRFLMLFVLLSMQVASVFSAIPRWDWDNIDLTDIMLPELRGFAISEFQVSGAFHLPHSQWALDKIGSQSGKACDFWNLYEKDIELIQETGGNSFRFSVDWSAIEPQEGVLDQAAIEHYVDLVRSLTAYDIEPMVTLHHFSHPQWFEEKGGFAKRSNIKYFVRFCKKIFSVLVSDVKLWCTINEIGPFVFQGYISGAFPPGKNNPYLALTVMSNMMEAHCKVYQALKKMPGGAEAQIGLVHQYLTIEAQDQSWFGLLNPLEQAPARFMNYIFNDAMLHALKNDVMFPWNPLLRREIKGLSESYDFIGLNFYSRVVIESCVKKAIGEFYENGTLMAPAFPSCKPWEVMTDMDYPVCPESFYYALVDISTLGVPIYVTENGVPDDRDDRRDTYIRRYLYALSKAIKEGIDIRGYYYWSFMDNFEWDHGYAKKFGVFEVDFETQERILRPGAYVYRDILLGKSLGAVQQLGLP